MSTQKALSSSHEDYLEAIYHIQKEKGWVRVKDISDFLHVRAPSVNGALNFLSKAGLVDYEKYGRIELSEAGRRKANLVQKKHDLLISFLTKILKVDPETAAKDACRMEHVISSQTHAKLASFMQECNL